MAESQKYYLGDTLIYRQYLGDNPSSIEQSYVEIQPEATAFLTATGITDPTISAAVNTLVADMKSAGIYSKMVAVYPFVGGTATTHKYNLINPVDTNAGYRLTFSNMSHSSDGILITNVGTTSGGAYTHIRIDTVLSQNDVHYSTYIGTNPTPIDLNSHDMGAISGGNGMQFALRNSINEMSVKMMDNIVSRPVTVTDSRAFWIASRTLSTSYKFQKNNDAPITVSANSLTPPTNEYLTVGALGTAETVSTRQTNRQIRFASVGDGLSDTEMDDFYTAVQAFQTTLGRQV